MRYTITSQQLDSLRKEGHIEFAGFYSPEKASVIKELLDEALKNRDKGRDLERENPPLLKALNTSMLGQVTKDLFHRSPLKVAYTQYFPKYKELLPLKELSCISEIQGYALINLSDEPVPDLPYLPLEKGDASFFLPDFIVDFDQLASAFLLIAISSDKARYILQKNDPNTHELKRLGYGFGDRLTEETHPLIIK